MNIEIGTNVLCLPFLYNPYLLLLPSKNITEHGIIKSNQNKIIPQNNFILHGIAFLR